MKKIKILLVLIVTALFVFSSSVIFADTVVITGTINSDYQLVSDSGEVYNIGENEKGEELMELEGKKVEVKGKIVKEEDDDEDTKVLMVSEFKVKG